MLFKNETREDVIFPVISNKNLPSSKFVIKDGETKDVPECAIKTAREYGLTMVDGNYVDTPIGEIPVEDTTEVTEEEEVKAEQSSIGDVEVETKQVAEETAEAE